jgi:hypothetical protein
VTSVSGWRPFLWFGLRVPALALAFWLVLLGLFSVTFAAGDAAQAPTGVFGVLVDALGLLLTVLAFPLGYLDRLPGFLQWSRTVFGDDGITLMWLYGANAVLWAVLIAWLMWRRMER